MQSYTNKMKRLTLLTLIGICSLQNMLGQTISQNSSTSGIIAGLEVGSFSWISEDFGYENYLNGMGVRAQLRYGINESFSLGLNFLQSFKIEDYTGGKDFTVNVFQLEGRLHLLGTGSKWRPTLAGSFNLSAANPELFIFSTGQLGLSSLKGTGIGVEAGINYYLNVQTALNLTVNYITGNYTNVVVAGVELSQDAHYNILYFSVGARYQLVP